MQCDWIVCNDEAILKVHCDEIVCSDDATLFDEETMAAIRALAFCYFVQSAAPAGNEPVKSLSESCNSAQARLKL